MPISPTFESRIAQDYQINFSQCMPNGCLKYPVVLDLFQHTASHHADIGGISFSDMQVHNQAFVMSRMRLEIDRLPRWQEDVQVHTWIVSLENNRSIRALEIRANGKKILAAETFWAVFNTETRRPDSIVLPHDHFIKYQDDFSTQQHVKRIVLEQAPVVSTHRVRLSDLDIVKHVNNVKYVEWCLDALPIEVVLDNQIAAMDMNYIKELRYDDLVEIRVLQTDFGYQVGIYREEIACFALEVELKK